MLLTVLPWPCSADLSWASFGLNLPEGIFLWMEDPSDSTPATSALEAEDWAVVSPGLGCSDFSVAVLRQGFLSKLGGSCHAQALSAALTPDTTGTERACRNEAENVGSSGLLARAGKREEVGWGSYGL